ncbi:MAG: hypothetical protein Q7R59_03040 [bacterium]|nr:hypothetical protein [bacterium]
MEEYRKGFIGLPILIGIVVLALFGGIGYFISHNNLPSTSPVSSNNPEAVTSSPATAAKGTSPFGTMLAFNINDAAMDLSGSIQKGWTEFRKDTAAYQTLKSNLEKNIQTRTALVRATGFSLDRELVPYFTWNVIEPSKGQFDWDLTDQYAQAAVNAGVKISAVIQPFASWDQKGTVPLTNCNALDFAYYDYKVGPPNDLAEYENFLTKTVERYKSKVAVWEIGNEYDGPCGGYENNPQGYFDLLKMTSETIKKAYPQAIVTNGGASEMVGNGPGTASTKNFWTKFFVLGGGRYIDYFNFHYNTERSQNATLDPAAFQKTLTFLNDLMDKNGGRKPLYLTEFGIYSGSPSSQPPGGLQQGPIQTQIQATIPPAGGTCGDGTCDSFEKTNSNACPADCGGSTSNPSAQPSVQPVQRQTTGQYVQPSQGQAGQGVSANAQAALYFKDVILAFASGVKVVFIDLIGSDSNMVGSSMAFNTDNQPRLFLTMLKTISTAVGSFSKVDKIANGQYKFTLENKTVYTLWSGTLPNGISGNVTVTDMKGQKRVVDATAITISVDQPILVAP